MFLFHQSRHAVDIFRPGADFRRAETDVSRIHVFCLQSGQFRRAKMQRASFLVNWNARRVIEKEVYIFRIKYSKYPLLSSFSLSLSLSRWVQVMKHGYLIRLFILRTYEWLHGGFLNCRFLRGNSYVRESMAEHVIIIFAKPIAGVHDHHFVRSGSRKFFARFSIRSASAIGPLVFAWQIARPCLFHVRTK